MSRELLIDAYNVMFAHPKIGPLVRRDNQAAREEFLALVAAQRPPGYAKVFVVFDAHRSRAQTTQTGRTGKAYDRGLHVVYARETADVWIQNRLREAPAPQDLTVMTSDREILATVEAHKAGVLRVATFLQLRRRSSRAPGSASDKPTHMSRKKLAEWQRLFEERDDTDED